MTCCIGKARIYYKEPLYFELVYKLPNGSSGSVTAGEPLTTDSRIEPIFQGDIPIVFYYQTKNCYDGTVSNLGHLGFWGGWVQPGRYETANPCEWGSNLRVWGINSLGQESLDYENIRYSQLVVGFWGPHPNYIGPVPEICIFKVIGADTGTVYREISGEECPTVVSNNCVMSEERYIDVEMGAGLPLLPSFIPDCLIALTGFPLPENAIQIRKIRVNQTSNTNPLRPRLPELVLTLNGLPGCPAEYRIVCCPNGECEPEEQCPPDTDCALDCGNFVCCYKNGRVIATVRR